MGVKNMVSDLRIRRWKAGISLDRVAMETGIDRSELSRFERGLHRHADRIRPRVERALDLIEGKEV